MATLTLRNIKGSSLTFDELDSNFLALDSDITSINNTIAGGVGLAADSVNSLIDGRIDSSSFVDLSTAQTISGIKTFSDIITATDNIALSGSGTNYIQFDNNLEVQDAAGAGTTRFAIDSSGKIGLGTVTPSEVLDVVGNATISGSLVASGLSYPIVDGATGTFLTTDGSGALSFAVVTSYDSAKVLGQIDARIDSDDFVNITTTQTVGGIKTFTDSAVFSALTSNTITINSPSQDYTLPDSAGRDGQVLISRGDGSTEYDSVAAGAVYDVFWENAQLLRQSHTIVSGRSAMSAGPITIDSDVVVTIDSGSRWVII
jgi:hypothetical protein